MTVKPDSMSIREFLIKIISQKKKISVDDVGKIISFQFDEANNATANNNSIEISGFGKFVFNQKRADKQMQKYLAQEKFLLEKILEQPSENEIRVLSLKLHTTRENMKHLKPKLCQDCVK
jgi:nucleoid DNA-binding protein